MRVFVEQQAGCTPKRWALPRVQRLARYTAWLAVLCVLLAPIWGYNQSADTSTQKLKLDVKWEYPLVWEHFLLADSLKKPPYLIQNWNVEDGLPVNDIRDVVEGPNGYIWITTADGLVRFDGSEFEVLNNNNTPALGSNRVDRLYLDPLGRLWVVTEFGHICYRSDTGFVRLKPPKFTGSPRRTTLRVDSEGKVWLRTHEGIYVRNKASAAQWEFVLPTPDSGYSGDKGMELDPYGGVWYEHDGLVRRYYQGVVQTFPELGRSRLRRPKYFCLGDSSMYLGSHQSGVYRWKPDGLSKLEAVPDSFVTLIKQLPNGRLAVGYKGGLTLLGPDTIRHYPLKEQEADLFPWRMIEEEQGCLWVRTAESLKLLDLRTGKLWTYLDGFNFVGVGWARLARPNVFFRDSEGVCWTGSLVRGLYSIRKQYIRSVSLKFPGGSPVVNPVMQDSRGDIWLGFFQNGLARWRGDTLSRIKTPILKKDREYYFGTARAIAEAPNGNLFAGYYGIGILELDLKHKRVLHYMPSDALPFDKAMALYTDSTGRVWAGMDDHVCYLSSQEKRFYCQGPAQGVPQGEIRMLYQDRSKRLWAGGTRGLAYRSLKPGAPTDFQLPEALAPLADLYIRSVWEDTLGGVWIGTYSKGLFRWQAPLPSSHPRKQLIEATYPALAQITQEDGLYDNGVFALLPDEQGMLWASCNRGVYRLNPANLLAFLRGEAQSVLAAPFNKLDGMAHPECNGGMTPAAWRLQDGRLLFSSQAGPVIVNQPEMPTSLAPPALDLVELWVDDELTPHKPDLQLPAGSNRLRFQLSSIQNWTRHHHLLRYRIRGFEKDWNHKQDLFSLHYTNLPPGQYQLEVQARVPMSDWSPSLVFPFSIQYAYYERPTFQAAVLGVFLLGVFLLYRRRERVKTNRAHELELRLAQERMNVQQSLEKEQNAVNVKQRFLANVSHEFRNPLNAMLGSVELLDHTPLQPEQQEYVQALRISSEHLLALTNDLLEFSRLESHRLKLEEEVFNLSDILDNLQTLFQAALNSQGNKLTVYIAPETPLQLCGDHHRLLQILVNLVANANKFTQGGRIRIRIEPEYAPQRVQHEVVLRFLVQDSGKGIAPENLEYLFEPYNQASDETVNAFGGSGLGLSIVKQLVELQYGQIEVQSTPGQGTTFLFTLPYKIPPVTDHPPCAPAARLGGKPRLLPRIPQHSKPAAPLPEKASESEQAMGSPRAAPKQLLAGYRILVAEDVQVNRLVAKRLLQKAGANILLAENGLQALELLRSNNVDFVLMDLRMPEMDGLEATRRLRKGEAPGMELTPVLAFTANVEDADWVQCRRAGMNGMVEKPLNMKHFYSKLEQLGLLPTVHSSSLLTKQP